MIKDFWCNDCSKWKSMDKESRTKGLCKCCKLSRNSTGTKVINARVIKVKRYRDDDSDKEKRSKVKIKLDDLLAARELSANLSNYGE